MNRNLSEKEDYNSLGVKRYVVNIITNNYNNTIDDNYNCISDMSSIISDASCYPEK